MIASLFKKIFGSGDTKTEGASGGRAVEAGPVSFVEYVIRALVDAPSSVDIRVDESERKVAISVRCAKADMGKVIGRRGRTVGAIRSLAAAATKSGDKKVVVDIVD